MIGLLPDQVPPINEPPEIASVAFNMPVVATLRLPPESEIGRLAVRLSIDWAPPEIVMVVAPALIVTSESASGTALVDQLLGSVQLVPFPSPVQLTGVRVSGLTVLEMRMPERLVRVAGKT